MEYNLNKLSTSGARAGTWSTLRTLLGLMSHERRRLFTAFTAMILNSALNLTGPILAAYVIDHFILGPHKDFRSVLQYALIFLAMYLTALGTGYLQTFLMAGFGQRLLYALRNSIFGKLQELPVAFFNQNKAGDLISRVNNDTDKLNQFFSQSLMQFLGSIFIMTGAGVFLLAINWKLGLAAMVPAILLYVYTKIVSPWVKRQNATNLKSVGALSAEVQEGLNNFKVIIAFNRRDFFRARFEEANSQNYRTAVRAGIANNSFLPVFGLVASAGQLIVLLYGLHLVRNSGGVFTYGKLIAYLAYVTNFYNPMRQLAALWANFQVALAGWDRISKILHMISDLQVIRIPTAQAPVENGPLLSFQNVHFSYPDGKEVLHNISFELEKGKTYAFIGPTGGGKTTTANLVARLYDPTKGQVRLSGRDIRGYEPEDLTRKIGFILQEPILFSGTIRENILYGNDQYRDHSREALTAILEEAGLSELVARFDSGLDTPVSPGGESLSLGQRQLIAFIRAVLRHPDLLILDEATANIDTVTEKMLETILHRLPPSTTRVIIAHRLGTIESADEIYFVNAGEVIRAGSMENAVELLMQGKRVS